MSEETLQNLISEENFINDEIINPTYEGALLNLIAEGICEEKYLKEDKESVLLGKYFFLNQKETFTNKINAGTSTSGPITPANA